MPGARLSDRGEAEMLSDVLRTPSAAALRGHVADALVFGGEEDVLSVGCGPGLESAAIADRLDGGRVVGVDANPAVLADAAERCAERPAASFLRGDATALPVADDRFDAAVAKQVLQFVSDVPAALAELARALAPGGRLAVVAGDERAAACNTADPERFEQVRAAYRAARPHPHLGTRLASLLPDAGLAVESVEPVPILHAEINAQVERGLEVHRDLVGDDGAAAVDAWAREQRDLDAAGEFLYCGLQFVYLARAAD